MSFTFRELEEDTGKAAEKLFCVNTLIYHNQEKVQKRTKEERQLLANV